jgi:hypothetical protein
MRPAFLDGLFTDTVTRPLRKKNALAPMNVNYFEEGLAERFSYPATQLIGQALEGHVVFLGGAWSLSDQFLTASGSVPGVLVHSAAYFTRENPVSAVPHGVLLVVETLIAMALLRVFSSLWEIYFDKLETVGVDTGWRMQLAALVRAAPWAAAVFAITALVVLGSILGSGLLLAQATWLNFGPIAIGAALKARQTGGEVEIKRLRNRIRELEQTPALLRGSMGVAPRLVRRIIAHRWLVFFLVVSLILVVIG